MVRIEKHHGTADFAVENEIGCVGVTIPACFHDEAGAQMWIEGTFRVSKTEGEARRCANKPKPTKGYGASPLGTGLGDPLHKVPFEGLTAAQPRSPPTVARIRSARGEALLLKCFGGGVQLAWGQS
ncbi:hypothetical protein [Nocardia beijingensis]|uniref:Uncharacterized protein n=1 Tax=Nocardia beijingensis TaxID=95162 RepID=A0ABW7WM57_9NOCA